MFSQSASYESVFPGTAGVDQIWCVSNPNVDTFEAPSPAKGSKKKPVKKPAKKKPAAKKPAKKKPGKKK